ncbi:gliding motility-associated ABC transporter substrate-binding protein GldG [Segetibacter sp. 3557_3]|uniref:gliding motility-associated ABC transporter substrate-binding protein GldG n=1 Tax=Segetibacter sp. 3557_3 TaxID=2547429 RepID=UPI001058AC34|nr:gliding motility-associated ABC transporter substrate-binding protein GldG [Segetibacter sp. 3557_3]TDH26086.1 gliding motility-associated ABC transporter substrate-binding protein GldG [Segetibacter sp. 3557_3]
MRIAEKLLNNKLWWLPTLLVFIAAIYLVSVFHYRLDLTTEKRYSLSPSTKELLKGLDEQVQVDVLLTGELSAGFKRLGIATDELLAEFREYGGTNLQYRFVRPGEGMPDSLRYAVYDSLVQQGIRPFNNQVTAKEGEEKTERLIFPAALVKYGDRQIPVDLMSGRSGQDEESTLNYSEALLEFKFADAIHKLTRKSLPVIAYAAGNGEPLNPTVKDLFEVMSNNYRFGVIDLARAALDPDTIQALLVVKPSKPFNDIEKLKIDQYVLNGGNVIWFIDKLYAEMDSLLRAQADFVAFDKNLNIEDLLFKYGVRINNDLLQDLKSAKQPLVVGQVGDQPQIQRLPFPYYPLLTSTGSHPVSKNLDDILSIFPGSIDTIKAPGIRKTVLLTSDTLSRTLSSPALVSLQSVKTEEDLRTFNRSYLPVAVLLEGRFSSLYANRLSQALRDSLSLYSDKPFTPTALKESRQIVVSDGDLVTNTVSQTQGALPMGKQQYENYQFANKDFLLNAVDYLVSQNGILETRAKDVALRLLDKAKLAEQKTKWQYLNLGIPVVLVLLFGWLYQVRRKRLYSN